MLLLRYTHISQYLRLFTIDSVHVIYTATVSPDLVQQVLEAYCNGCLDTGTVESLTKAKYKHLISMCCDAPCAVLKMFSVSNSAW
jgi:hypothetical protein